MRITYPLEDMILDSDTGLFRVQVSMVAKCLTARDEDVAIATLFYSRLDSQVDGFALDMNRVRVGI